ncbi:branched-chain amino acid ABC transporter permease [soil metagenome]
MMDSPSTVLTTAPARAQATRDSRPLQRGVVGIALVIALAFAFPTLAELLDQGFYIGFATRVMIFVIAVSSLNLLVGYAGLISFGHAAYFGMGSYAIAMLAVWSGKFLPAWTTSAWVAWPFAMLCSGVLALLVGAVALRTKQVYFIMITLAFSQMVYFLFIGMTTFGSDNGMSLKGRSPVGLGIDLANDNTFYYVVLALLLATLSALRSIVRSRFGVTIQGICENESRMAAIGVPVYKYKLVCFVIAGAIAGLAGALLANQNSYVSPSMLDWTKSGSLLVMVILGGAGYLAGGIYGAVGLLVFEELLVDHTEYWQFFVGIGILVVVLMGNNGIASLIHGRRKPPGGHG